MFYPLERKEERKWAKIFNSSFEVVVDAFKSKSLEMNYEQKIFKNTIFWHQKSITEPECMFCFIKDISDFNNVFSIFKHIKKYKPFLTYAIVHQKKDGETTYDIFRFSKFSYLEHCNRVK